MEMKVRKLEEADNLFSGRWEAKSCQLFGSWLAFEFTAKLAANCLLSFALPRQYMFCPHPQPNCSLSPPPLDSGQTALGNGGRKKVKN